LNQAMVRNVGTCRPDAKGEIQADRIREDESTEAGHRGGVARSRVEGSVMELDRRSDVSGSIVWATRKGRTRMDRAKPFCISKREVWRRYKRVKANRGRGRRR